MPKSRYAKTIGVTLLIVLFLILTWRLSMPDASQQNGTSANTSPQLEKRELCQQHTESEALDINTTSGQLAATEEQSLDALQTLLDDEERRQDALAKALSMSEGSVSERLAAIDAFRWLGGNKAIKALIQLRKQSNPIIAAQAGHVLSHLFTENMYREGKGRDEGTDEREGELVQDPDDEDYLPPTQELWLLAIQEAPTEADRDELLIILAAHPIDQAMPIFLKLLDSPNDEISDAAKFHLEAITNGEEILTREQGEKWLADNMSGAPAQPGANDAPDPAQ